MIINSIEEAIQAALFLRKKESIDFITNAASMISECYQRDGKIIIAGNGGSLCDASHFAEELTGQFRSARKALAAISLADPGHMSCVGNDMGFDRIFSRGVEALGREGDIFIALTTSGNSQNLVNAMMTAKEKQMKTIAFLGKTGGKLKGFADLEWIVSGFPYSDRVQEAHMAAIHIIIEAVEATLFPVKSLETALL